MYEESNPLGLEFLKKNIVGKPKFRRIKRVVRPTKFQ